MYRHTDEFNLAFRIFEISSICSHSQEIDFVIHVMIINIHQFEVIFERNIHFALWLLWYLKLDAP